MKNTIEKSSQKEESESHIKKTELIKDLSEKIKNSKTLMIVSIKNLPSKQFQEIKKSLRGQASIIVAKKNIMLRTLKKISNESLMPLEKYIQENCAFTTSDLEGFELAGVLSKKKTPVAAKTGQIAPEDIEIKAGPTNLVPGPAISELGSLGIQISIEEGKISIKNAKIIARKGEEINSNVASMLQKLDIHPFKIGLNPVAIYDFQTGKIYVNIDINPEQTLETLKISFGKALGFAQRISHYCRETIGYLIAKAGNQEKALSRFYKEKSENSQLNKPEEA